MKKWEETNALDPNYKWVSVLHPSRFSTCITKFWTYPSRPRLARSWFLQEPLGLGFFYKNGIGSWFRVFFENGRPIFGGGGMVWKLISNRFWIFRIFMFSPSSQNVFKLVLKSGNREQHREQSANNDFQFPSRWVLFGPLSKIRTNLRNIATCLCKGRFNATIGDDLIH